jgi:hypothetical protein
MHILIGLGLAVVLLYFWLIGNRFARVLMFLLLAAGLGVYGGLCLATNDSPVGGMIGGCIGIALAWPVAGIPIYFARFREAQHEKWIAELCARQRQLGEAEMRQWREHYTPAGLPRKPDTPPPPAPPSPQEAAAKARRIWERVKAAEMDQAKASSAD